MTQASHAPPGEARSSQLSLESIKTWLARNNWAYWALMVGGVVGIIVVAVYLLRHPNKEKEKA